MSPNTCYPCPRSIQKQTGPPAPCRSQSLAAQPQIVSELEAEQRLVAANRELIARFEQKIATTLARIWGEGPSAPAP